MQARPKMGHRSETHTNSLPTRKQHNYITSKHGTKYRIYYEIISTIKSLQLPFDTGVQFQNFKDKKVNKLNKLQNYQPLKSLPLNGIGN
jgi:hypothetical protein